MTGSTQAHSTISDSEFRRVNRLLVKYLRRRMNENDAEDLAASAWLDVARYYEGRCSLDTYAFTVARYKLADSCRRRARQPTQIEPLLESEDEEIGGAPAVEGPSLDSMLMLTVGHEALVRALEQIQDDRRRAVILWLAGHTSAEIAAELGVRYNTARSRLERGRAQLRAALERELGPR